MLNTVQKIHVWRAERSWGWAQDMGRYHTNFDIRGEKVSVHDLNNLPREDDFQTNLQEMHVEVQSAILATGVSPPLTFSPIVTRTFESSRQ
jgi:hypothetical protein